jgi:hypothetical protein
VPARRLRARNLAGRPKLTEADILRWADAYHEKRCRQPSAYSGQVADTAGETWSVSTTRQSEASAACLAERHWRIFWSSARGLRSSCRPGRAHHEPASAAGVTGPASCMHANV